jgi:hypothetical protein
MENDNYNQAISAEEVAAEERAAAFIAAEQAKAFASAMEAAETLVLEETAQPVVEAPAYQAPEEVQALGSVADGVIGASTAPRAPERKKSAKAAEVKETVALFSTKNVTWPGVGKVYRGYNIVEKNAATQWLTRSHIKPATPEEVAKEFGK